MACLDGQPQAFKHHCRVCKKGFMCGRALGGHMRAHGIGDEYEKLDDDDIMSDWEDKLDSPNNKKIYQLRTNPNRQKSCRNCEHCGKEFLSWKSFLEHGKCNSGDTSESFVSSPDSENEDNNGGCNTGWSKRKRSLRTKVDNVPSNYSTSEEDDLFLAKCLVQLANTVVDPPMDEPEESCASASREEKRRTAVTFFGPTRVGYDKPKALHSPKGLFECITCKKVFHSHQALGGHRASHKKVKGCYAAKQEKNPDNCYCQDDDVITHDEFSQNKPTSTFHFGQSSLLVGDARRKTKVHECSICHRVFPSGQALGGHKRCHWIVSNAPEVTPMPKFQDLGNIDKPIHQLELERPKVEKSEGLDLNVPAWAQMSEVRRDPQNPLSFDVPTDPHVDPWTSCETETISSLATPSSNT